MQIYSIPGVDWTMRLATEPGRCSVSGQPISYGDTIYVTAHEAFSTWRISEEEYSRYIQRKLRG